MGEKRSRIGDESPADWHPRSTAARLAMGSRLGPYRIDALVGSGGMGDVYRGVDTRLERPVAIKVSAKQFGGRFDREAHAIAALNHPNICTLYDVGPDYLVMELVEGETLATRLRKGALPSELVVQYGLEIARALRSAHDKRIVHRDLKPANVMVTKSGVKVLDFGLAKTLSDETRTVTNAIVGTPAYMAPEQLAGHEADTRTDIYAFGLMLYEMATGKRLGGGQLPPEGALTPALAQVVRSCLADDPDKRWQSVADVEIALGWTVAHASPSSQRRGWWPWAVAAVFAVITAAAIFYPRERPLENGPLQLQLNPPPGKDFRPADIALSPDGKQLAFVTGGANPKLWVRALDSLTARELRDTDGAALPFWSPDQRALGFFAGGKVKRIDLDGERVVTLADAPAGRGGSWNADNVILFSAATNGPIWRVPAGGGSPAAAATTLDTEASHRFPAFLPDGRHFLFYVRAADPEVRGIYWASLDNPRVKQRVVETMFAGIYAPPGAGQSGRLFWMTDEGGLIAQTFDAASGRVSGDAALVPSMGLLSVSGYDRQTALSISSDGTMVYGTNDLRYQLGWYDRQGRPSGTIGEPDAYLGEGAGVRRDGLRIAPDGARAAVALGRAGDQSNVWLIDFASGNLTRVTADGGSGGLAWSPNGQQLAYMTGGAFTDTRSTVFVGDVSGTAPRIRLTETPHSQAAPDWSPDGKFVLFQQTSREANFDLWFVSMTEDRQAVPYLQTPHHESGGRFSPDGKWVAYTSDQSGRQEIWVAPFPQPQTNQQVSFDGGDRAVWRKDGRELFYRSAEGNLMTIPVEDIAGKLRFGKATILFAMTAMVYDVAPEHDRFLMLAPVRAPEVSPLIVLLNWQQKLKP